MIERHQDYQLTIPSVPVGGLTDVPLKLDTDAPFLLRLVKSRNLGLSGFRFQDPDRQYQSSGLRTDLIPQDPTGLPNPQPSRGVIIYPQMLFPIGANIVCDVGNSTDAALSNVKLLFRGSKLFPDGAVPSPTYPAKMSVLPFTYPVVVKNVPAVGTLRDLPLTIKTDADFAMRYGVADPFTLGIDGGDYNPFLYTECYVRLRDEFYKAYSNEPIHINDLLGQGQPAPFRTSASNDDDVLFMPGLFTPEIYIPRAHSLYFDITRNDPASGPIDLHFRFQGSKVFAR